MKYNLCPSFGKNQRSLHHALCTLWQKSLSLKTSLVLVFRKHHFLHLCAHLAFLKHLSVNSALKALCVTGLLAVFRVFSMVGIRRKSPASVPAFYCRHHSPPSPQGQGTEDSPHDDGVPGSSLRGWETDRCLSCQGPKLSLTPRRRDLPQPRTRPALPTTPHCIPSGGFGPLHPSRSLSHCSPQLRSHLQGNHPDPTATRRFHLHHPTALCI